MIKRHFFDKDKDIHYGRLRTIFLFKPDVRAGILIYKENHYYGKGNDGAAR